MKQMEISIAKKKRVKRSRIYFKDVNESHLGSFRIILPHTHTREYYNFYIQSSY